MRKALSILLVAALLVGGILAALVAYLISRKSVKTCQYFSIACAVVEGVIAATLIFSPEEYFFSFDGLCALGINLAFDGFSIPLSYRFVNVFFRVQFQKGTGHF